MAACGGAAPEGSDRPGSAESVEVHLTCSTGDAAVPCAFQPADATIRDGAHGGDFGTLISPALGRLDTDRVVGVHVKGFLSVPPRDPAVLSGLIDAEKGRLETVTRWRRERRGYAMIQATRPQTLAYGLTDSPVGLLAWLVQPFKGGHQAPSLPSRRPRPMTA